MNKNTIYTIVFTATLSIFIAACNDSEGPTVPNTGGNPLKGAYILYGTTGTTDYAFYDAASDSVKDFLFSTSNPGKNLRVNPGEMKINSDRKIYLTALGIPNQNGSIYKIDPENNQVTDSLSFGVNPSGFAINNNRIVVSNSGSSNVTILDLDFNTVKDTVETGPNPGYITYAFNKYFITRTPSNTENSIALMDEINSSVSKLFYPSIPISSIYNVNGVFVSMLTNKKIYRIEQESYTNIDSFEVPTVFTGISKLIFKSQNSFFAVCGTREIWLGNASSGTITFTSIFPATADLNIYTAAYETNSNELYLGVFSSSSGSQLIIIDGTNGTIKKAKQLGGIGTASIVFRYF